MQASKEKCGFLGLKKEDIKKGSIQNLSDQDLPHDKEGEAAREDAIADLLINKFEFYVKDVEDNLKEIYITTNENMIVWMTSNENFLLTLIFSFFRF